MFLNYRYFLLRSSFFLFVPVSSMLERVPWLALKVSRDTFHFPWKCKLSFSVIRVVQGEAKTPKIMGCCRANFAFLPAWKIGIFRGKWTLEWVFKTSLFVRLALYFCIIIIKRKTCFFFACLSTMPSENCKKKTFDLEWRTVQKITFCLYMYVCKPV